MAAVYELLIKIGEYVTRRQDALVVTFVVLVFFGLWLLGKQNVIT